MKKICYIHTVPMTLNWFVLDSAKYLYESGEYDITFICDYDEEFAKELPDYIKYIPVRMDRGISITGITAFFKMIQIFKKEKFDLVQYSTPNASFYAAVAAKISKVPVRLYSQWGILYVSFSGVKRKIFKWFEKKISSFSTWIQPDSYGNLKFSHDEGLYTSDKSSVIGHGSAGGINLNRFNIQKKTEWKNEIIQKHHIDANKFIVGFMGRITKDKGINELLQAFSQLTSKYNDVLLLVIGSAEGIDTLDQKNYKESLENKNIIYCGSTNEAEKYFAALDLFVLPSYREGFGTVIIEAESMGVPVIVTDIPGPTDAMEEGRTGLVVKKKDVEGLYSAMEFMYENRQQAAEMGKNGRKYVENYFDSKVVNQLILEDKNRLIEDHFYKLRKNLLKKN